MLKKKEIILLVFALCLTLFGWRHFVVKNQHHKDMLMGNIVYQVGRITPSSHEDLTKKIEEFNRMVLEKVARDINFKIKWVSIAPDDIKEKFDNKEISMVIAGGNIDKKFESERKSPPYLQIIVPTLSFLLRKPIKDLSELKGLEIASVKNSATARDLSHICFWYRCKITLEDTSTALISSFHDGEYAAISIDPVLISSLLDEDKTFNSFTFRNSEKILRLKAHLLFSPDLNTLLKKKINREIKKLASSGWLDHLKGKMLYPKIKEEKGLVGE